MHNFFYCIFDAEWVKQLIMMKPAMINAYLKEKTLKHPN